MQARVDGVCCTAASVSSVDVCSRCARTQVQEASCGGQQDVQTQTLARQLNAGSGATAVQRQRWCGGGAQPVLAQHEERSTRQSCKERL